MSEDNVHMNEKLLDESGSQVTLAELAGLDIGEFAEKRLENLPKGFFLFECCSGEDAPKLVVFGEGDKKVGAASFRFKVLEVLSVTDPEFTGDKDELIGKMHLESFRLIGPKVNTADGIGYLKAFVKDIGVANNGTTNEMLARCAGQRFQAPIGKRKNPDNTDIVYTNIVRGNKIKPQGMVEGSAVAAAVHA